MAWYDLPYTRPIRLENCNIVNYSVSESVDQWWKCASRDCVVDGHDRSFVGADTSEEIKELVDKGWVDGARRAEALMVECSDYITSFGLDGLEPAENYDVSGAFVDVGAYCEGEPECMVDYVEQVTPRSRVARIVVNTTMVWSVESDAAMRRGVAIAAIIDALERAGIQCELWSVNAVQVYHGDLHKEYQNLGVEGAHVTACLIKSAGQVLPLDAIAFVAGHPGWARGIAWPLGASHFRRGTSYGYRECMEVDIEDDDSVLYIPAPEHSGNQFSSDSEAMAWAAEHVGQYIEKAMV